jgi:hypothetical protein
MASRKLRFLKRMLEKVEFSSTCGKINFLCEEETFRHSIKDTVVQLIVFL